MYTKRMLKELREFTGESGESCVKALEECEGDLFLAAGWLATENQHGDTPIKRMARAETYAKNCYQLYDGKLHSRF